MIKCILFDSDGTLVDSEYLGHRAMQIKLRERGIEEPATNMMTNFRGAQLARIVESLEQKHNIPLDEQFVAEYRLALANLFERELKPIEGVSKLLEKIHQAICVASGGPIEKIEQALYLTKLKKYFVDGSLFSSYQIGSWKPEPDLFLHAAQQMGFAPEECAVIEDSPVGIQAAIAANMQAFFYDPHDFYEAPAQGVTKIKHMQELELIFCQAK